MADPPTELPLLNFSNRCMRNREEYCNGVRVMRHKGSIKCGHNVKIESEIYTVQKLKKREFSFMHASVTNIMGFMAYIN